MLEYLEQQKKLTINQWKIFAAATIGDMLDFFTRGEEDSYTILNSFNSYVLSTLHTRLHPSKRRSWRA